MLRVETSTGWSGNDEAGFADRYCAAEAVADWSIREFASEPLFGADAAEDVSDLVVRADLTATASSGGHWSAVAGPKGHTHLVRTEHRHRRSVVHVA